MTAPSLANRQVVITGANSGVGKETTRELARMGASIVMACRDRSRAEPVLEEIRSDTGNGQLELMELDLADMASIRAFSDGFAERHDRLDVLVNNAGAFSMKRRETRDGFELTFGTNHLGPFLLTHLLLPSLRASAGARIVNVSSAAHYNAKLDLTDLQTTRRKYRSFPAYADSKLANVLFTQELAIRLVETGITVNALHPGHVSTNIFPRDKWYLSMVIAVVDLFAISAAEGAKTSIYLASSDEVRGVTGKYYDKCRPKQVSEAAQDPALGADLWKISEELTGI